MGKLSGSEKGKDSLNSPPPLRLALHSLGGGVLSQEFLHRQRKTTANTSNVEKMLHSLRNIPVEVIKTAD